MSISAAHADSFITEVSTHGEVWPIRDAQGFPTSTNPSDEKAMPFWSLESRARKIIASVPAYTDFEPHRLSLEEFKNRWLPGLARDGLKTGLNWSGTHVTGYDMEPSDVLRRLEAHARNGR